MMPNVIMGAALWMVQRRERVGFTIERLGELRVVREVFRKDFEDDGTIGAPVRPPKHVAHASGTEGGKISNAPSRTLTAMERTS
jgi:hypothetical protein